MVDTTAKADTERFARASGFVRMLPGTVAMILDRTVSKGDVREVARLAGIMAAKKTSDLIPLCHPLPLSGVSVDFSFDRDGLRIEATARVFGKTGVEMEALTAVSIAALTVYDMVKSVDRRVTIERIRLEENPAARAGPFCGRGTIPTTQPKRGRNDADIIANGFKTRPPASLPCYSYKKTSNASNIFSPSGSPSIAARSDHSSATSGTIEANAFDRYSCCSLVTPAEEWAPTTTPSPP